MDDTQNRLFIARIALREIANSIASHPGAHACAGADCATCRPDHVGSLARIALARTGPPILPATRSVDPPA